MKILARFISELSSTILGCSLWLILAFKPDFANAQFQHIYGILNPNSFHRVIPDGADFYVLGFESPSATVTRIDQTGQIVWTQKLDFFQSTLLDAVVMPGTGNLLAVGYDNLFNNVSLIVELTRTGTYCAKTLDEPGVEALLHVDVIPGGTYIAVGTHNVNNSNSVVVYNISPGCQINYKKHFLGPDGFQNDIEVISGTGDFLVAGASGNSAVIYQMSSSGNFLGGVQGPSQFSYFDVEHMSSGDILAVANTTAGNNPPRLIRFDANLIPKWEYSVNGLDRIEQVVDGGNGNIYVLGKGIFGSLYRAVIIKIHDSGGPIVPMLVWIKYFDNNETSVQDGHLAVTPTGGIAFVDSRNGHPNTLGFLDAFMAVTDGDLTSMCTSEAAVSLIPENTLFEGPIERELLFYDVPVEDDIAMNEREWLDANGCGADPCIADFSFTVDCNLVYFTDQSSLPNFPSWTWSIPGGSPSSFTAANPVVSFSTCGTYNVCLTVTGPSGLLTCNNTVCKLVSIVDTIPPIARCSNSVLLILDNNCTATVLPGDVNQGSTDNCDLTTLTVSPNTFNQCGIFPVTLTARDWCNNLDSCTTQATIVDNIAPMITCPPNMVVSSSNFTPCAISVNGLSAQSVSDNCGIASITYSVTGATVQSGNSDASGLLFNQGISTVAYTATDVCGNTGNCSFTVTVECGPPPDSCEVDIALTALDSCGLVQVCAIATGASPYAYQWCGGQSTPCITTQLSCEPEIFCVTVTCADGTPASDSITANFADTIPPTINCPQDVFITTFPPDCAVVVHNIHSLGATDNCSIPTVSYVITGATSASGFGDASGQLFQPGTSTVTYIATDDCNNQDSCSFNVVVECDTCTCLGFDNLSFYNFLNQSDIPVGCDSTAVQLPCIGSDALYSFKGDLLCSAACPSSIDYEIIAAGGGPPLLSGTVFGSLQIPGIYFSYGQLSGPGNYQLILTGNCSGDTCVCIVNFTLPECCNCGGFSDMTYRPAQGTLNFPATCGDTLYAPCDFGFNPQIAGLFQCIGTQCPTSQTLNWVLEDSLGMPIHSGTAMANPNFLFALDENWFVNPGVYTLVISGQCGGQACEPCVFYLQSEGCLCCDDFEAFCALVDEGFTVEQDGCTVTVCAPQFDSCHFFSTPPDFGDSIIVPMVTVPANGSWTHTYTQSGVYTICADVFEETCWNKEMCVTIDVVCMPEVENCCFEWAGQFSTSGYSRGNDIAVDAAGNVFTIGVFTGTVDFDPGAGIFSLSSLGGEDVFISKIDKNGNFLWAKQIGGVSGEKGTSIALDAQGDLYATGTFGGTVDFDPGSNSHLLNSSVSGSDTYVIKLDNSGNFVFARQIGGFASHVLSETIALDAAGNIHIAGYFFGTVDFDPGSGVSVLSGNSEFFVCKLDQTGAFVWAKQMKITSSNLSEIKAIDVDFSGNVNITGYIWGTIDFNPGPGVFNLSSTGGPDIFISQLDQTGNFVFAKLIGGSGAGNSFSITSDIAGNIYTTGFFSGTYDFDPGPGIFNLSTVGTTSFISKYDQVGNLVWAKKINGTYSIGHAIALDGQGDIYITGWFGSNTDFDPGAGVFSLVHSGGPDVFILKLGKNGNFVWAKQLGGSQSEKGISITVDAQDNVYTTGQFAGIVDFDPGTGSLPLTAMGAFDAYVHKLGLCLPDTCYCGTFSDLFVRGPQGALSQPVSCGGPPLDIGCPQPGIGYTLTGSFQCEGDDCPMEADVDWDLLGPDGASVATGTTQAAPWFILQFPSVYFVQSGVYTLILNGHCGSENCLCIIELLVEEGCPEACPCDLMDLQADVNQGFASTLWNTSCRGCFSPLELSDCDSVEWYVNNPIGTPVGVSAGNETFCHTFPGAGTYTVYMTVTRRRSDGSLCESFGKAQTVTVTCLIRPDCDASVLANSRFNEGATAGPLNDIGSTEGWNALLGNPTVIEGEPGSNDGWTIQLTGNYDGSDVLSHLESICLEKDTGTISIHLRLFPWGDPHVTEHDGKRWDFKAKFYQGDNFEINNCDNMNCLQLASIDLSPFDTGWATLEIPYDLKNWDIPELCGGILVRPVVYVTNLFGEEQGADTTRARLQIDNFCIDGMLVGVEENAKLEKGIHLIPNPTHGPITLRFEGVMLKNAKIQIFDLWGRLLRAESLAARVEEHTLSLAELPRGIYVVSIWDEGDQVWIKKLVKL